MRFVSFIDGCIGPACCQAAQPCCVRRGRFGLLFSFGRNNTLFRGLLAGHALPHGHALQRQHLRDAARQEWGSRLWRSVRLRRRPRGPGAAAAAGRAGREAVPRGPPGRGAMTRVITTIGWTVAGREGRRSDYAGATAPVRLGARRHHSAHGTKMNQLKAKRQNVHNRPIGA